MHTHTLTHTYTHAYTHTHTYTRSHAHRYTVPLVFYTLHRRWTTRRPMSELLGALGENDEPDPGSSSSNDDEEEDMKVSARVRDL